MFNLFRKKSLAFIFFSLLFIGFSFNGCGSSDKKVTTTTTPSSTVISGSVSSS